jgi:hypothetical protein
MITKDHVCACFQLDSQPDKQWFVWSMKREIVGKFSKKMAKRGLTLRMIVRVKSYNNAYRGRVTERHTARRR